MSGMRRARQTNTMAPASRICSMASVSSGAVSSRILASGASWRTSSTRDGAEPGSVTPSIATRSGSASRTA
jgi:hypothetical protein